jgi:FKBP-type peptidyl-prolyl cis-trans isomerase FkpA
MTPPYSQTDLQEGTGAMASTGQTATVNYTGWLYSETAADNKGAKFDSSIGRGPFAFRLGAGQVIRGWDQGVQGMKVGGQRRLVLPPEFAYGSRGAGGVIPPNATLVFDVELLDVK